jgi:hypothetical protein
VQLVVCEAEGRESLQEAKEANRAAVRRIAHLESSIRTAKEESQVRMV